MDFFEAQDRARRTTGKLVVLYATAVVLIIISVYLVALVLFGFTGEATADASLIERIWKPDLMLAVSTILIILILTGTLFRIAQLRKGGSAVAEMLGGRKVEPSTRDHKERQLLNVVEEMSIASGLPVPDIYVLNNEENINAFAAGFDANDAAVGVTRGTLEKLNRDELQGVIAHEFSHIFNGDMRLNIRLIGILNGILLLHLMGMILMRSAAFSRIGRSGGGRGGSGGGGQATIVIIVFGLVLLIVGYIGMLFGRMIQAAISRQREYLADAAAVQYTRNPDGIASALRKIGEAQNGSKINDGHAMELSHLFFANSYYSAFDRLFATHPPLEKRIRAVDPSFDQEDQKKKARLKKRLDKDRIARAEASSDQTDATAERAAGVFGQAGAGHAMGGIETAHPALRPEVILAAIGTLEGHQVTQAGKLLESIPAILREAAHEPLGAEALIVALLLSGREPSAGNVPDWFLEKSDHNLGKQADLFLDELNKGSREWFLPLAELALPTLRQMSEAQYQEFRNIVERLIREDDHISLFDFAMEKMIVLKLDSAFTEKQAPKIRHHHFKTLGEDFSILLSAMAHASESDTNEAWKAGMEAVKEHLPDGIRLLTSEECTLDKLDKALNEFSASAYPVKKYALGALVHCIYSDKHLSLRERELLRTISEVISCPIPLGVL